MDDLISRKELHETLAKLSSENDVKNLSKTFTVKELDYIIANQPTAYNVDAVVGGLKESSEVYCAEYKQRDGSLYLQDAIEIVKKG